MIKICTFSRYSEELSKALLEKGQEFSNEECLGRCDLCMKMPFVKIDHEFITGETVEDLVRKL
ncbi:DUF1450 domain-containing protein [Desnuesiella massiliensis]|uniref:DUF1450 domain-containing protein n=1 Tax=Desnuesiella massiliensis TaxID=1650662 RepID=UPI0006E35601|nr:DUF1450 domain-containing protein [Desnuesiella massiliensis]